MSTTRPRTRWIAAAAAVALLGGGLAVAAWAGGDDDESSWPEGLVAIPLDRSAPRAVDGIEGDVWEVEAGPNLVVVRTPDAVVLVDPATGARLAAHPVEDGWATLSPPVAWGERAVVALGGDDDREERWVVSTETGERLWSLAGDDATGHAVPLGDGALALVRDLGDADPGRRSVEVVVRDGDGTEIARTEVDVAAAEAPAELAVALDDAVVVVGDGEAVAVGADGTVGARVTIPGCPSATGTLDGDLVLGHEAGRCGVEVDQVARLDWPTGEEVWRTEVPVTPTGRVPTVEGPDGPVVLAGVDRPGAGLDGADGAVLWDDDDVRASADGVLTTVAAIDGEVVVQRRDPTTAEPVDAPVALPGEVALATTRHLVFALA